MIGTLLWTYAFYSCFSAENGKIRLVPSHVTPQDHRFFLVEITAGLAGRAYHHGYSYAKTSESQRTRFVSYTKLLWRKICCRKGWERRWHNVACKTRMIWRILIPGVEPFASRSMCASLHKKKTPITLTMAADRFRRRRCKIRRLV
jgi:hypothetical protein